MHPLRPDRVLPLVIILASLALFAQESRRSGSRVVEERTGDQSSAMGQRSVVDAIALPAIDRGYRPNDMPREAATAAPRVVDRTGKVRGPYVPGRVIVKFRDSLDRAACSRVLAQHG